MYSPIPPELIEQFAKVMEDQYDYKMNQEEAEAAYKSLIAVFELLTGAKEPEK